MSAKLMGYVRGHDNNFCFKRKVKKRIPLPALLKHLLPTKFFCEMEASILMYRRVEKLSKPSYSEVWRIQFWKKCPHYCSISILVHLIPVLVFRKILKQNPSIDRIGYFLVFILVRRCRKITSKHVQNRTISSTFLYTYYPTRKTSTYYLHSTEYN